MIRFTISNLKSLLRFTLSITFFFSFLSCSSNSLEDFSEEGEGVSRALTLELKRIRSRDDLLIYAPKLEQLFDSLVYVIIEAQKYQEAHPDAKAVFYVKKDHSASDELRIELNRILYMEGGREVIEKVQENSLNRLELYHKTCENKI